MIRSEGIVPGGPIFLGALLLLSREERVDGFRLELLVHQGGMAMLWHVTRPDLDGPVLMKVPRIGEGADPGAAVKLRFANLPAGVSGPGEIALTAAGAEQFELEVELSAAADAPLAKAEGVQVEAVTMFAGQETRAASPAGVIEVVAKP